MVQVQESIVDDTVSFSQLAVCYPGPPALHEASSCDEGQYKLVINKCWLLLHQCPLLTFQPDTENDHFVGVDVSNSGDLLKLDYAIM